MRKAMYQEAVAPFSDSINVWVWHQKHVQPTRSLCSFRACRILATAALCWSSCSSWFMMPNRLLQEISQSGNYIEAACWHSNVLASFSQNMYWGGVCSNLSCTILSSFGSIIDPAEITNTWCNYICYYMISRRVSLKVNSFFWRQYSKKTRN